MEKALLLFPLKLFIFTKPLFNYFLIAAVFAEAVKTVNRPIPAGPERNFGFSTAVGTGCGKHFALGTGPAVKTASVVPLFSGRPALGAASRLVREASFRVELLLGSRKVKLGATVTAG